MKITVTQEDIDNGKCGDGEKCAVANALVRQLPDRYHTIFVEPGKALLYVKGQPYSGEQYTLPSAVKAKISRFDKHAKIRPFEFELPIPEMLEIGKTKRIIEVEKEPSLPMQPLEPVRKTEPVKEPVKVGAL